MSGEPPEVRLGNDIARHHAHLPPDEAVPAIATHISKFWEARMRSRLLDLVAHDDSGMDPLLAAAARGLVGGAEVDQQEKREPSGG